MSLTQTRMSLERDLLGAKIITCVWAIFALADLVSNVMTPMEADFWSIGLNVIFVAMTIYGLVRWRRARNRLREFEAQHGRDAGRQDPVR